MDWLKKRPKRVAFLDRSENGVTETKLKGPLNGRLTCLHNVTEWLASRGHAVEMIGRHPRFTTDRGVVWTTEFTGKYDALVILRGFGDGEPQVDAKKRIFWPRDLPHTGFCPNPDLLKHVLVVSLSEYADRVWRTFHPQIRKSVVMPNGVDEKVFYPGNQLRKRKRFVFASNPNRGLDRLPLIFETLRALDPEVEMVAFSDRAILHPGEGGDYADAYDKCIEAGINLLKPVSQKSLANFFREAGALVMPTDYPETCGSIFLQALACGLPVITTGSLGAAAEHIRHGYNGLLTSFQRHDYQVFDMEMVRNCKAVVDDEDLWRSLRRGAEQSPVLTWAEVGRKLERHL